jgi:hypothetical protein
MPIKIYLAGAAFRKKKYYICYCFIFLYKFTKGSKKIMLYYMFKKCICKKIIIKEIPKIKRNIS